MCRTYQWRSRSGRWRQDQWAQAVEALGDKWGRGIRYGEDPNDPERAVTEEVTRRSLWQGFLAIADALDRHERGEDASSPDTFGVLLDLLANVVEDVP